ncbi:ribonuclease Z [Sediminispirochaeta bajacaliforniensis]|uniref:ribonuclease Z n=1 Tax=Sediminispirochaeta bajacaliforniensis TaxID=148 RepID=UPI0003782F7D|nr:ribonuclease Z [Sediminispirochaeta bajacaliforniensis]
MNLECFVLGTGGMMPLPGRHLTSALLRRDGDLFLFDCGEGTQVSLRKLNLRWKKISAIFISHTHADHVTGLPGIMMLSSQVDREEPLTIIGPPKIREYVETARSVLDMYINYEVIIKEIDAPCEVYRGEGYAVRAFPLLHSKPCVGYVLEEDTRPGIFHPERAAELGVPRGPLWSHLQRGEVVQASDGTSVFPEQVMGDKRSGRKFAYVTDTKYIPEIASQVSDSDLLICEGMFLSDLEESAAEKKHLTAKQAATIAKDAGGIKRMGLIHYSPRYTMRDLRTLLKEAKTVFPETFLTEDQQQIEIPYDD